MTTPLQHDLRNGFHELLASGECYYTASVFDPMSARIAADLDFEVGILGGSAASLQVLAAPDFALITLSEFVEQATRIGRVARLPVIADADHGYGNALNVMRTITELERAGIAAVTIEDTLLPVQYGHKSTDLISIEEGVGKMRAALEARVDPALSIIARTNAGQLDDDAVGVRIRAYQATGVDAICLAGVRNFEHLEKLVASLTMPLMLVTYDNPALRDRTRLAALGVRIVVNGHAAYFAAIKATYDCLREQRNIATNNLDSSQLSTRYSTLEKYRIWAREYMDVKEQHEPRAVTKLEKHGETRRQSSSRPRQWFPSTSGGGILGCQQPEAIFSRTEMTMTAMQWERLLDPVRLHDARTSHDEIGRSPFHKDYDRIVFSGSFRRLGRKTQVHPLTDNDHIHTRLTHSIEVGCVGRSLGMIVGEQLCDSLPGWVTPADLGVIVQAACLGHDIGNPPFGHAGEYAIRDWFKWAKVQGGSLLEGLDESQRRDLLTYEGNAQGFRIITQIEYNQFHGGMRLSAATLGSLLKYPWTVEHGGQMGKFGCYQSEKHLLIEVAEWLGLKSVDGSKWCRHPLAYLVEAADDICYALLDLEDGLEMGILRYEEVAQVLLQIAGEPPTGYEQMAADGVSQRRRVAALRGAAMERAVNEVGDVFVQHEKALLNGMLNDDLLKLCHPDLTRGVSSAKQLARERIFQNERKAKLEIGAYTTLGILLEAFIGAAHELHHTGHSSFKHQRVLALIGENTPKPNWPLYDSYRRMLDFIGGMTDHYAVELAQEMSGRFKDD